MHCSVRGFTTEILALVARRHLKCRHQEHGKNTNPPQQLLFIDCCRLSGSLVFILDRIFRQDLTTDPEDVDWLDSTVDLEVLFN